MAIATQPKPNGLVTNDSSHSHSVLSSRPGVESVSAQQFTVNVNGNGNGNGNGPDHGHNVEKQLHAFDDLNGVHMHGRDRVTEEEEEVMQFTSPGMLPEEVYDRTMGWWRVAIRRRLMKNLVYESRWLAAMQDRVRTPWLDAYFVYTSSLGTHTFFMTVLPAFFFFGYDKLGHGLLLILAGGVYVSSFVKDLACSPRPFSPPVTRLTISTHHLEYGFPSTHATNSVSIALYILAHVHSLYTTSTLSVTAYYISLVLLALYTFSIVYGRLYTAMHSFTDCTMGVVLGAIIWAIHWVWEDSIDTWVVSSGWKVPLVVVPICLIMVNQHPQPVDDCPCFEDAIAFVSVSMGSLLARWHAVSYGFDAPFFTTPTPGNTHATWTDTSIFALFVALKMVVGVLIIFTWRIFAKSLLHAALPPTFRLLAQAFTLPHRRFYTPATDYTSMPLEKGLHPIPSVIDLPGQLEMEASGTGMRSPYAMLGQEVKMRNANGNGGKNVRLQAEPEPESEKNGDGYRRDDSVKHYDATVLTKVIVYCGIALLACEGIPVMFEVLGWGVHSS